MPLLAPSVASGSLTRIVRLEPITGNNYYQIDDATKKAGCVFVATGNGNMTGCIVGGWAGSGGTNGLRVDLYAVGANGLPTGSSLANGTGTPQANGYVTITFGTPYTHSVGTTYALVCTNVHGTPATNYLRLARDSTTWNSEYSTFIQSTDGTNWVQDYNKLGVETAIYPVYATSGTLAPMFGQGGYATVLTQLYNDTGSRRARLGLKINSPIQFKISGVWFNAAKTGSPTFNVKAEICSASAVLATSGISEVPVSTNVSHLCQFATPYLISANTDYYVSITPNGDDDGDSSNYIRFTSWVYSVQTPTIGLFRGGYESTVNGSTPSWSATSTYSPQLAIYAEFPTLSSSGGGSLVGPSALVSS